MRSGRLLAQAPIDELLLVEGAGVAVYELVLQSDSEDTLEKARTRLRSQNWVSFLEESPDPNGGWIWLVGTTDESLAEENLLRLILDDRGTKVAGFGRKRQSLEEAFFDLIEDRSSEA